MNPHSNPNDSFFEAPAAHSGPYDRLYASREDNILWGETPTRMLAHLPMHVAGLQSLDVGCGDGVNSLALEALGFDNTGIDVSALALNGLANRAKRMGVNVEGSYHRANVRSRPAGIFDRAYDVVVSSGLFHCLDRAERNDLHEEINRLVRPGGLILFSTLTDEIEVDDLHGTDLFELPSPSEVEALFAPHDLISFDNGVIDDRHPPIVGPHQHSITWVVARTI